MKITLNSNCSAAWEKIRKDPGGKKKVENSLSAFHYYYIHFCEQGLQGCHQGLFYSSHHPTSDWAGGAQETGMGHSWDSWLKVHSIPYSFMVSIYKLGKRRAGEMFRVIAFVFQVATTCDRALLSWRWLNISLPMGSGEGIPWFNLLW